MVPDWFTMNDDGLAECPDSAVPAELEEQVREAAEECPAEAILVE
jgi:ferredoxin